MLPLSLLTANLVFVIPLYPIVNASKQLLNGITCKDRYYIYYVRYKLTVSDALVDSPGECTKTEHRVVFICLFETLEQRFCLFVSYYSEDGTAH